MSFQQRRAGFRPRMTLQPVMQRALRVTLFFTVLEAVGIILGAILSFFYPNVDQSMVWLTPHHASYRSLVLRDALFSESLILLLWAAGQNVLAPFLVSLLLFLRGISLGLALALTVSMYGGRGVRMDLLDVLPWNILSSGAYVLAGTAAYLLSRYVFSAKAGRMQMRIFLLYCMVDLFAGAVVLSAALLQVVLDLRTG